MLYDDRLGTIFVLIIATIILCWAAYTIKTESRCPDSNNKSGLCFDGNGTYQHKGRGSEDDSVEILLRRIDWLGKNGRNRSVYPLAYVISYFVVLSVFLILLGFYPTKEITFG